MGRGGEREREKMAGVSPAARYFSPAQQLQLPTPSPFSFSVASTRWSSRPPIHHSSIVLRFLALLFSFISVLALAGLSSKKKKSETSSSFIEYPELTYSFIVTILAFIYSTFQLFKGVCDIAHRGILISDMISDYISFIFDQLVGYLLLSSSSVTIPIIQQIERSESLWKAAVVSTSMSFATFLVFAVCGLLSGYKLCKRIVW